MALPGVIRSGSIGTESLSMGTMPSAQQQITMGQMHRGHMPPLVRSALRIFVHFSFIERVLININAA